MDLNQGPVVWHPSDDRVRGSRLQSFLIRHQLADLAALRIKAAADPAWFWDAVVKMLDWPFVDPYHQVLDVADGIQWARWFVGGTSNVALAALDRHVDAGLGAKVAVIDETESGGVRRLNYAELQRQVDRMAWGLESLEVSRGDRIAVYLPMGAEAVIVMLAAAKVGAVVVPIFSGYGAPAMATRLRDSEASVVVTADGFMRRGRTVSMKAASDAAVRESPTVRCQIVVSRLGVDTPMMEGRDLLWDDVLRRRDDPYPTPAFPSETPLLLIYTSGTTGRPKGALHPHLGFPLKAAQDLWHAFDLQAEDILFWYTDMGWMMGPWMVYGGLITGCTLVLYDGTPDYPNPSRLWDMIDRHQVSIFGISPTAVRGLMVHGDEFLAGSSRQSLRILGSSGEPWNPDPWMWFFDKVGGRRCPIINYSGGTEVSGGILSGFATEPQKPCAFNGPIPGMVAEVVDDEGRPTQNQVGELVLKAPWPGMTRGFWRDRQRYWDTYWDRWPGVWVHGDFAYLDDDAFWYILGRSDDTIKVAGKRLGPSEVESVLVSHSQVAEAAAIGVPDAIKGESLVCFVVAVPGHDQTGLGDALADFVAQHMGKALRPASVHLVNELPKTRNGKVVRRAIKSSYLGRDVGDVSAIENVGALEGVRAAKSD